jgi:hypothetical protein
MPVPVNEYLGIDRALFDDSGAFNCILDRDSLLFIDPVLARNSKALGGETISKKILGYFRNVISLLELSKSSQDVFFKRASALLIFKERKGTCLGYSQGTSGRGIGVKGRNQILKTTKEIIDAGIKDPELIELLVLFEEGVGCDLISDMITNIVFDDIVKYTHSVLSKLAPSGSFECMEVSTKYGEFPLPSNPYNGSPIILVPKEVLQTLPVAYSFEDIDWVSTQNSKIRNYLNSLVLTQVLGKRQQKLSKAQVREILLSNKEILREVLDVYRESTGSSYDFDLDPAGEVNWLWRARSVTYPKDLQLASQPSLSEVQKVVNQICSKFKQVVENNKGWIWFYRDDSTPHHESAAQLLFFAVAVCYCDANDIDLSPEVNRGRGPVDFKLSKGQRQKVVVELKLTSNKRLIHGIKTQLPEYLKGREWRTWNISSCSKWRA